MGVNHEPDQSPNHFENCRTFSWIASSIVKAMFWGEVQDTGGTTIARLKIAQRLPESFLCHRKNYDDNTNIKRMNKRLVKKNETREKRKSQTCKVYEVKIDHSHLS